MKYEAKLTRPSRQNALGAGLAALFAAVTANPNWTQVARGSGGGSRTPVAGNPVTTGPSQRALSQTAGTLYWEDGNPGLIGSTFRWDDSAGTFVFAKQLFSVIPNDETGPGDPEFRYSQTTSSGHQIHRSHFEANVSYSAYQIRAAANAALSDEVANNTFGASIFFGYEIDYPDSFVDLGMLPETAFNDEARSILDIEDPVQRQMAWEAAGYGPYVAFGYDLRGALGVNVTATDLNDYVHRERYFDLAVEYWSLSAGLTFEDALTRASESSSIAMTMSAIGLAGDLPPVPSLEQLSNPATRHEWVLAVEDMALTTKARRGLFLAAASALPNGPSYSVPLWDQTVLNTAAQVADETLGTLSYASKWNRPFSLRHYIDVRHLPNDAMTTYGTALNVSRNQVVASLQDLADAVRSYMRPENFNDPVYRAAIQTAYQQVLADRVALDAVLYQLDSMIYGIQPMTATVQENWTPSDANNFWTWVMYDVTIDNAALFRFGDPELLEWAHRFAGQVSLRVYEDDYYHNMFNLVKDTQLPGPMPDGGSTLRNISIVDDSMNLSGPNEGLRRIVLRFTVWHWDSSHDVRVKILDDLGRQLTVHHDLRN